MNKPALAALMAMISLPVYSMNINTSETTPCTAFVVLQDSARISREDNGSLMTKSIHNPQAHPTLITLHNIEHISKLSNGLITVKNIHKQKVVPAIIIKSQPRTNKITPQNSEHISQLSKGSITIKTMPRQKMGPVIMITPPNDMSPPKKNHYLVTITRIENKKFLRVPRKL